MEKSTIYIGADHAGFNLKETVKKQIFELGYNVIDMGAEALSEEDDYPDYGHAVAKRVSADSGARGIVLCGNAEGICMVANKVRGIRAAIGYNKFAAETSRTDDDANVLCLPGRVLNEKDARTIVLAWLNTPFSEEERHKRRIDKIEDIENEEFKKE